MSVAELLRDLASRGLSITVSGTDLRLQGPTEQMDTDLVARIRAAKPDLIAHLAASTGLALTPLQAGYLLGRGDLVELGNVASHVYHEIEGAWDVPRLERALQSVVDRHSALRTSFTADGRQVAHDRAAVHIRVRDLRVLPDTARRDTLTAIRERCSHLVLPVHRAPLVRAEVSILADDRMVLHVSHDGLVMDGISMFLFFRAWWRAYDGGPGDESEVELPFADYLAERERAHTRPPAQRSRQYWLDRLDDLAPNPALPLAASPASITRPRFTQRLVRLDPDRWGALKQRAARSGITPTCLLLAAYAQTLHAWGAGDRFTINTTIAHRPPIHPRVFDAIGQFSDTMLVEVDGDPSATFEQRATALQAQLHRAIENRHFSGVEVLREIGRRGDPVRARAPYTFNCPIGYVQSDVDGSTLELFGRETFSVSQTPQVWLNVFAMEQHGGLVVQLDGVDALFPAGLLDALAGGYQRLLDELSAGPAWSATNLDLRPVSQRRQRDAANDTTAALPDRLLADDFLDRARRQPDAPAVITSRDTLSYGQLHRQASRLAAWLREHGVARDELVGLVMTRGPEQVIGILATVIAGGAYLPVDAGLPGERREYMLRDGRVRCVLTNVPGVDAVPDGVAVAEVDATTDPGEPVQVAPLAGAELTDLAYVLYTSGTTGVPKGVMVGGRNVANVVADCNARFGVDATDRFFGISAFNFDLSVYDVFGALSAGAAIVLPDHDRAADPAHWLDLCESAGVTVWNSVPAIVGLLQEQASTAAHRLSALRLVMMSGDRIPPGLPAMLLRLKSDLEIISLGGPTETTIWNILHPIEAADDGTRSIPYGRPNMNNRAYVLDAAGRDLPDWVAGEICAAGFGLARGYWGDEERTRERFFDSAAHGERLYRTGDVGRYLPDGTIEIQGRTDFQIKVNGYRIEAGEVETRLVAMDSVKQAAVVRQEGVHGDRLVAHLAAAGDARPDLAEIRTHLRVYLPDYMVPSSVVWHDALPLTRNGKVDRAKLSTVSVEVLPQDAVPTEDAGSAPGAAPSGDIESELAAVWVHVLRVPEVTPQASFYDLGGDSLAAARVLTEVRKRFGVTIPLDQLYEVRTVRAMAARIEAGRQAASMPGRAGGAGAR
ncbi:MAG TPA: amino acid adenylation domain-containing protein [Micromonosporaceae bacterium]